jgi:hypothetical protein
VLPLSRGIGWWAGTLEVANETGFAAIPVSKSQVSKNALGDIAPLGVQMGRFWDATPHRQSDGN